ncbi:helix-turn-helix domain-containing protein [Serinicoccus marinus]|uniref:helix-turn-helix domain-containing protein n=1 Tax=Serinicoccus marinus TaxID=247333 RepID=UPI0003B79293|nr:helix-turn-helix transcriptional regulator [Serinicoccus marinus]
MTARPARNVEVDPGQPMDTWPYEAVIALLERGGVRDWARITARIRQDPWGPVARQVEDYLDYADASGVTVLLGRAIDTARAEAAAAERAEVRDEVTRLIRASGLTAADFARRIGTSPSRLSTYRSGSVVPSAALLMRMRRAAGAATSR